MTPFRKRVLFYVVTFLFLVFLFLTALVYVFPHSMSIDMEVSEEIQEYQHPYLDAFMKSVSAVGVFPYSVVMVLITALLFFVLRFRKEAIYISATLLSGVVSSALKIIINRPRPTEDLVRIIGETKRQSFPSGHVLFYVLFFGFMLMLMYYLKFRCALVHRCVRGLFVWSVMFVDLRFFLLTEAG
jgi:membrane-associated phospholipid phosphatase